MKYGHLLEGKKIKFGHGLHWKDKHDVLLELSFSCAIFQMEIVQRLHALNYGNLCLLIIVNELLCYTDFWESYANVLPSKRHRAVGKESGQTAHIERFNNTLRQRCPNLVRKTLSFSRNSELHEKHICNFIDNYNSQISV